MVVLLDSINFNGSAKEVRALRAQLKMTQSQMAFVIGVSTATLEAWESGRRNFHGDMEKIQNILTHRKANTKKTYGRLVFGKFSLKIVRQSIGRTCRQFATDVKCSPRTLEAYEQGRRPPPEDLVSRIEKLVKPRFGEIQKFANHIGPI